MTVAVSAPIDGGFVIGGVTPKQISKFAPHAPILNFTPPRALSLPLFLSPALVNGAADVPEVLPYTRRVALRRAETNEREKRLEREPCDAVAAFWGRERD